MKITFLGGAGGVTGSKTHIEIGEEQYLVDYGLFQGSSKDRERNWDHFQGASSKLQLKNMSMEDEEQYTYQVYQKQNGAISWKEFKKKLRRGDLVKLMKSIGLEV